MAKSIKVGADLAVSERVRHPGVELGDDETSPGVGLLDGGDQDVDLDAERDLSGIEGRCVQQDHVGRPGPFEEMGTRESRIGR
jgi:hypothetical protein